MNLTAGCFAINGTCIGGGGSGTPGGSNTQLQYNNGGSFGGATLLTYDSTNSIFAIGSSTPWLAGSLTLSSTTPILQSVFAPATSTAMTIGMASGTIQRIDLGTSAVTLTVSAFRIAEGESKRVYTCAPGAATAGAVTWAAESGVHLSFSGGVQPGNTTQAGSCDQWFLDVITPFGSTTPWVVISSASGFI
jgi:hypothetical protein